MSRNKRVESWVDGLLARDACYRPLELLLLSGRLPRQRYDAWRQGDIAVLEDALAGNPAQSLALLKDAAQWAKALDLEPLEEAPSPVQAGKRLRLFHDHSADRLARTGYRRRADHPQLNLFFDSPFAVARNRCCQALLDGDAAKAEGQWLRMSQADAHNPLLPDAEQLIDDLLTLQAPTLDADVLLARMQSEVVPRAQRLLGERAGQFVLPFWRRLSQCLEDQPFDPERDQRHSSWLAAQAGDWQAVVNAILCCNDCHSQPVLLQRLITASLALSQRLQAIAALIQLCWLSPDDAERWLSACVDAELTTISERFWDLEPAMDMQFFPAYVLICRVPVAECPKVPETLIDARFVAIFRAVLDLSRQPQDVDLRKRLGGLSPPLLALWLQRRG